MSPLAAYDSLCRTAALLALSSLGGCAAAGTDDYADEGHGAYEKSDLFYDDYAQILTNDATGRVHYGSCEDVEDLDRAQHAEEHGTTVEAAREELERAVKLAAFRKVMTLKATLAFMRASDAYQPAKLADQYLSLPDFADYYDYTEQLNQSLEFQSQVIQRSFAEGDGEGDVQEHIQELNDAIDRLEGELEKLEGSWWPIPSEANERRATEIREQILALKNQLEAADPDRAERRQNLQRQLLAAAFEVEILHEVESWLDSVCLECPYPYAAYLKKAAAWENHLDPSQPLTAEERISQIYAQFPILAIDDSWLFFDNDLAERLFPHASPERTAKEWADELSEYAGDVDEQTAPQRVRAFIEQVLDPEIARLEEGAFDAAIQEEIDWALDHWMEIVDQELGELAGRSGSSLMEYADLVDAAIASAKPSMQPLWLSEWCAGEAHRRWIETGKMVFYIGAGIGSLAASLLGQMQIAVPLGMVVTTAFAVDAIHSAVKAGQYQDAQSLFWLSHDRYGEQERKALIELIFAGVGVAAEVATAVHLLKGWRSFQSMKGRLEFMAHEYDDAERALQAIVEETKALEAAGGDVSQTAVRFNAALRASEGADEVSKIASRTLQGVHAAESSMGRIEVASLMGRFADEAEALAFFESITRHRMNWSSLTEMGYRNWLKAVKESRATGTSVELPAVCR